LEGAKRTSENPFFQSRYADLAECWAAIRKPLTDNGLSVSQSTDVTESGDVVLETLLLHESGEFLGGKMLLKPEKTTPQSLGSCITYARRYALMAIVGIAPVDDDGNAASQGKPPEPYKQWDGKDWRTCPVHFGNNPGVLLGVAKPQGVAWLNETWEPGDTSADRQLVKALMAMSQETGGTPEESEPDEGPSG